MNEKLYSRLMMAIIASGLTENVVQETVEQLGRDLKEDQEMLRQGGRNAEEHGYFVVIA